MKNRKIQRAFYALRHNYLNTSNLLLAAALVISAAWAWGAIGMMQRNYELQKQLNTKVRQQRLVELEVASLSYEQKYYQSREYQELSARMHLGLAAPGERVLILPPNSNLATQPSVTKVRRNVQVRPSNFEQWVNFLFGSQEPNLPVES